MTQSSLCTLDSLFQTGKTTTTRRIVVRETRVSRHYGGRAIECLSPQTPGTTTAESY